jgi:hypothetical protein
MIIPAKITVTGADFPNRAMPHSLIATGFRPSATRIESAIPAATRGICEPKTPRAAYERDGLVVFDLCQFIPAPTMDFAAVTLRLAQ